MTYYDRITQGAVAAAMPFLRNHPRFRDDWNERIGVWDERVLSALAEKPVVWMHCASVGEVQALAPLYKRLVNDLPQYAFLVTAMTDTGIRQARKLVDGTGYAAALPFDRERYVGRVLETVKPFAVLVVETELWPVFLRRTKAIGAKLVLVNGRISERSFPRYRKVKNVVSDMLSHFDRLLMNGKESAERIVALGAPEERVAIVGNVKWAGAKAADPIVVPGWEQGAPVLLAASTHAGEEEIVLRVFKRLRASVPELRLVLAPRHPQRMPEVESAFQAAGVAYVRRSDGAAATAEAFLVDTLGELAGFFPLADVVFMGGSMTPVGGHNVLEPAAAGKPIVYGTHMANFSEIAETMEKAGASLRVEDEEELHAVLAELFADGVRAQSMGEAGMRVVRENEAVLDTYVDKVKEVLGGGQAV